MARPWRLRHKLTLGLALVVGSVGLLLGGAMFGLSSYLQTQRTTSRKLEEIKIVFELKSDIERVRGLEADGATVGAAGADGD